MARTATSKSRLTRACPMGRTWSGRLTDREPSCARTDRTVEAASEATSYGFGRRFCSDRAVRPRCSWVSYTPQARVHSSSASDLPTWATNSSPIAYGVMVTVYESRSRMRSDSTARPYSPPAPVFCDRGT